MVPLYDSSAVDLVVATPAQLVIAVERHSVEWANGVSPADYAIRETLLGVSGMGNGITCWVLAPKADPTTLDFFCSCEVYRRPVLVSSAISPAVHRDVSYSIASVFTPPQHRKQGHCRTMMSLLHSKIGRPANVQQEGIDRVVACEKTPFLDAKLSFLYSDVGEFYKKCNWHILEPTETKWTLANLSPLAPLDPALRPLGSSDLAAVCAADSHMLRTELAASPAETAFAVEPTGEEYVWLEARVFYYADKLGVPRPTVWGAESGVRGSADWSLILFTLDYYKKTLKVTRTRCASASTFRSLLNFCLVHAQLHGLSFVTSWVVDPNWLSAGAGAFQGETSQRIDSLSAVSWYGSEAGTEDGARVAWLANEQYAWV